MPNKRRKIVILLSLSLLGIIVFAAAFRVIAGGSGAVAGY